MLIIYSHYNQKCHFMSKNKYLLNWYNYYTSFWSLFSINLNSSINCPRMCQQTYSTKDHCCLLLSHVRLFCNPMDHGLPGSSVHGISQARILEWVGISFSWASSWPKYWTQVSCLIGRFFTTEPPGKPLNQVYAVVICINIKH